MTARQACDDIRQGLGGDLCFQLDRLDWTDIMVNEDGKVWVDTGAMREVPCRVSDEGLVSAAWTLASYTNKQINEDHPSMCAVIPLMGLRVIFQVPPVVAHPTAVFRRPSAKVFSMEEMVGFGTVTPSQAEVLGQAVRTKQNVVMAGGTGSGKTTMLNTLLQFIDPEERPYIIEDIAEIVCTSPNKGHVLVNDRSYTYEAAVRDSLRCRPDRIIIGECLEGQQTLQMLKSWNTGHPGGLCTIHATGARNALRRLDELCMEVTATSQERVIHDTVDIVAYMERDRTGRRVVKELLDLRKERKKEGIQ